MANDPDICRLTVQRRPSGRPIMHQTWDQLIFLHWRIELDLLRMHIPDGLTIDTFDGEAWISISPFTMRGVRPAFLPAIPGASATHELNVRTYVHRDGQPGVWFFSLDASNPVAVLAARLGFSLPYYQAEMQLQRKPDGVVSFSSKRLDSRWNRFGDVEPTRRGAPARRRAGDPVAESMVGSSGDVEFKASWRLAAGRREAQPSTLEFFLTERYCLYTVAAGKLKRARIYHPPWKLADARLLSLDSTMIQSHDLPQPQGDPLVHAQAESLDVEVWPLKPA